MSIPRKDLAVGTKIYWVSTPVYPTQVGANQDETEPVLFTVQTFVVKVLPPPNTFSQICTLGKENVEIAHYKLGSKAPLVFEPFEMKSDYRVLMSLRDIDNVPTLLGRYYLTEADAINAIENGECDI